MNVKKIRVFFKDPTVAPFPFIGITIKTTSLTNQVSTAYTFNETAHSGWNYVDVSGTFLAIEVGGTGGCDHITEIEIDGDVILADSSTSKACDIQVQGTGNPVTVTGTINYQNTLTSVITSITPEFGSAFGGDVITITGTSLTSDLNLVIGGASCTSVTQVSGTQYTCTTAPKVLGSDDSIKASIQGKGVSIKNGVIFEQYYDWSNPETW